MISCAKNEEKPAVTAEPDTIIEETTSEETTAEETTAEETTAEETTEETTAEETTAEETTAEETTSEETTAEETTSEETTEEVESEVSAIVNTPEIAIFDIPTAEASGIKEKRNSMAVIDYSNVGDGYVMAEYLADTDKKLKVQVKGPTTTYTYNVSPGKWEILPLSDGNGSYKVTVYQNASGTKYANVLSASFDVTLKDEFAPFIRPNQYVSYSAESKAVKKAAEITAGVKDNLKKVEIIYDFVVDYLEYDKEKATNVKSGYLPDLDEIFMSKKGICFDYAAMMTAMLRSQNVPTKLVVGYAGSAYHAWISVWSEHDGWIDGAIFFDGSSWQRMDPTFASSANKSESIMEYIGNGKNYSEKYLY
ncbi:MAG: transglutaminase domain-containing protein [Clostridia bacterium]|nr:transglutaminase domain-containing protein [Clostridia bacterium]